MGKSTGGDEDEEDSNKNRLRRMDDRDDELEKKLEAPKEAPSPGASAGSGMMPPTVEPAPADAWVPALADAVGAPAPRHVPVWLGRLAAGEALVSMFTATRGASNAKAKRELDWKPRYPSWRDGFHEGLADPPEDPSRVSEERPR